MALPSGRRSGITGALLRVGFYAVSPFLAGRHFGRGRRAPVVVVGLVRAPADRNDMTDGVNYVDKLRDNPRGVQ